MYVDFQTPDQLFAHYAAVKARINRPVLINERKPVSQPETLVDVLLAEPPVDKEVPKKPAPDPFKAQRRSKEIIIDTAAEFGVSVPELMGERRARCFVMARRKACYLMSKELGWSLPRIGRLLKKDHTTVLHAIRCHQAELDRLAREATL